MGAVIGRMVTASPKEGERFFLRMLLAHLTGPTSFEAVRTLDDDTVCATFREAAFHRGLMDDDKECDKAMAEAVCYRMPAQLRIFFCVILVYNAPLQPDALLAKYAESLSEDYPYRWDRQADPRWCAADATLRFNVCLGKLLLDILIVRFWV